MGQTYFKRVVVAGLISLAALWLGQRPLYAQAVYGSINGSVTDPSGAAVPGATVTVTNENTGISVKTTAVSTGEFQITHLIAGTYDVSVDAKGFKAYLQKGVGVLVDVATTLNIKLELGEVTQQVTVTGGAPVLQATKSEVTTTFNSRNLSQLPIFQRNFTQYELLTPGTSRQPWQHAASENPQGSQQIQVNGLPFWAVDYQLDGTDNRDPILGIIVINPNVDAITEAKVTTADYDAEFGNAAAAVITTQTKSGSNDVHGETYYFRRDQNTSARNPFTQSQPIVGSKNELIPPTLWQQFGATLGGPIRKNRVFIFGDYQGTRQSNGGSLTLRVPTAANRNGDLRDLATDIFDPQSGTDPATRSQFTSMGNPGIPDGTPNVIPFARLSQQTQNLLNLIPFPNLPGATGNEPNFATSGVETFNTDSFDIRYDDYGPFKPSDKFHEFGRFSWGRFNKQDPGAFGNLVGGPAFPGFQFAGQSDSRDFSIAYGVDYPFKPNLLADFRFGFFRYRVFVNPNGLGTTPAADAGIPGLNTGSLDTSGTPAFFINGQGAFNFGYALGVNQCNCPLNEQENQAQWVTNWTYLHGKHTFKWGADIRFAENLRIPSDTHRAGELSFNSERTEGPNGGGLGLAGFLLGDVSSFGRFVSSSTDAAERQIRMFYYGQDTMHLTPKLTLNLGVRWEIYNPERVNKPGNGSNFDPATGEVIPCGRAGFALNCGVQRTLRNWAGRAGIAYRFNNKTVIRVGYGRSFDVGVFGSLFGHAVTQNLPVLAQQSRDPANAFDSVFTLAQGPQPLDPNTILESQPKGIDGLPLLPDGVSSFVRPLAERVPTVDNWNFTIQRELGQNTSVSVAYVGNKSTHIGSGQSPDYNFNAPALAGFGTLSTNQRKPFFQKFGLTQPFRYFGNDSDTNYNSLQTKVERRFASGFTLLGHYTYSQAFIHDDGFFNINRRIGYERDPSNRRHAFVLTGIWQLPFGKGQKFAHNGGRLMDALVGGWQVSGIGMWQSGQPFTPTYKDCGSDQDVGVCRVDVVGNVETSIGGDPSGDFTTTNGVELASNGQTIGSFRRPQPGHIGNATPNSFTGPQLFDLDAAFFKNFDITERVKAQFRAESFNFGNNVQLGQPDSCVDCDTGGRIFDIASGASMRRWQFSLKLMF